MYSDIASEIWGELKRYVNTVDRSEAADILVSLLIDHDEDAEDIREAFKGDSDVKRALVSYINNDQEEDIDEDEEDIDDDSDWEN
jgi:hypothetical protein